MGNRNKKNSGIAEKIICRALTDSRITSVGERIGKKQSLYNGDIEWLHCGHDISVEVKYTSTINVNQVRACRYCVIVIVIGDLRKKKELRYVVYSPDYIIKKALERDSGQSVEDATLSFSFCVTIAELKFFGCKFEELEDIVNKAYLKGERNEAAKYIACIKVKNESDVKKENKKMLKCLNRWEKENIINNEILTRRTKGKSYCT